MVLVCISVFTLRAVADEINCQWLVNEPLKEIATEKYKKGYCYIQLGRFQEGVAMLSGLETELPLIADNVLYYRGVGENGARKIGSAAELFNKILKDYPDTGLRKNALMRLAEIHSLMRDYEKAERVYRSLYADESEDEAKATLLNRIGESLEKQGKPAEALHVYKELWVEFPESSYSYTAINKAFQIGAGQGIPFATTESEYLRRAERLFKLYRWGPAIENFERTSQTTDIRLKIAVSKFRLGSLDEASRILSQMASADSLYWTAKINSKRGRDDEASEIYHQIYLLYPQSPLAPEALYNAARLYQINSNFTKAITLFDLLLRKYPRSDFTEDGAWNLGWIYYKSAKYREALATFSAFVSSDSTFNSSRAAYWKARILEKQGRKAEASAIYESLSRSTIPSYYSYLASKKSGFAQRTNSPPQIPGAESISQRSNWRKQRAELLIDLGILEDAALEIKKMEEESTGQLESINVSVLYAKVNDFYNSIRVADGIGLPLANRLSYPQGFDNIVKGFSAKYNVDEFIVYSIIREESRFKKDAVSPANAVGLMQLIPPTGRSTAGEVGISGYNSNMLYVPRINIELGIAYFKKVLELFSGRVHLALASYNAGPNNAAKWVVRFPDMDVDEFIEEIPFQETRNYVRRVLRSYGAYRAIYNQ
jgi:soluble lytic murein transglycosylase